VGGEKDHRLIPNPAWIARSALVNTLSLWRDERVLYFPNNGRTRLFLHMQRTARMWSFSNYLPPVQLASLPAYEVAYNVHGDSTKSRG